MEALRLAIHSKLEKHSDKVGLRRIGTNPTSIIGRIFVFFTFLSFITTAFCQERYRFTKCYFSGDKQVCNNATAKDFSLESKSVFECHFCDLSTLHYTDLKHFGNIHSLTITNSQLNKIDSNVFDSLVDLNYLSLTNNNLSSSVDVPLFDKLSKLSCLNLAGNKINNITKGIFQNLLNLEELDLANNCLSVLIDYNFNRLENLKILNMSYNNLFHLEPKTFVSLSSLRKLDLSGNNLQEITEYIFRPLRNMQELNLSHNILGYVKVNFFTGLENLITLNLQNNFIIAIEDQSFINLNNCEVLLLQNNNISRLQQNTLTGMKKLLTLKLENNQINHMNIAAFQEVTNLEELNLSNNSILELPTGVFSNLFKLKWLDISRLHRKFVLTKNLIFPLEHIQTLCLDTNYFNDFDYQLLVLELKQLQNLVIYNENWGCEKVIQLYKTFRRMNIKVSSLQKIIDSENIHGIPCKNTNQGVNNEVGAGINQNIQSINNKFPLEDILNELIYIQSINKKHLFIQIAVLVAILVILLIILNLLIKKSIIITNKSADYLKID